MLVHLRDVIFNSMEHFCLKVVSDIWGFIEREESGTVIINILHCSQ